MITVCETKAGLIERNAFDTLWNKQWNKSFTYAENRFCMFHLLNFNWIFITQTAGFV